MRVSPAEAHPSMRLDSAASAETARPEGQRGTE
jgi:hypothetical protein